MRRPVLIAAVALAGCQSAAPPPMPPSPPSSRYLFVWAGDADRKDSDFLAVIDADAASGSYGSVVATLPVGAVATRPHHTEHEMPAGGVLWVNGFDSGQTFRIDLRDPLHPRLAGSFRDAGDYSHPHSYVRLPNGNVLSTFQRRGGHHQTGGLVELWAHKLRSVLTLTLLMLGVFALVVMTSVLDGVKDKVSTGFAGMSWDGTILLAPREPKTSEEQKRFAMSTGLRFEDLPRVTAPHPKVLGFSPRATTRSVVRIAGGSERIFVTGVTADYSFLMDRPIGLGRGITPDDQKRRSRVAVVGATLASKLFGGGDPVGRDVAIEGALYRIVGVLAAGQIFNDELYMDANGVLLPLETYMDRMDPDHKLAHVAVKLRDKDELVAVLHSSGDDDILMVSHKGQAIRFHESGARPMGRATEGVRGMSLREGDEVIAASCP